MATKTARRIIGWHFSIFLTASPRPVLGLDISSTAVKLVELSSSTDGYKVKAWHALPLPVNTIVEKEIINVTALTQILKQLIAESGTELRDVAVAIPDVLVITKEVELPSGLTDLQLGNILMVAPAEEIAEQKRLQIETNIQTQQLTALETVFLRIKYADAAAIYKLLIDNDSQIFLAEEGGEHDAPSILSNRGNAVVDERTNTIIVTDTPEKIAEFRRLIAHIDIPIKQVLIEARIVIANTGFKKELGVIWGLASGATESVTDQTDQVEADREAGGIFAIKDDVIQAARQYDIGLNNSLSADLGVSNASGSFSLGYLTDNLLIDLELSALELDGYAEIISQPKVLTADKQQAVIKSGTEIAYQKATSSGATSIEFKEAVLQLEVTPQITPDDRIIVDLLVSQDSVGAFTPSGEPAIDITQIETQVLVGDGQTLVLGGIFHTEEVQSSKKVPILGDIPFFGRLFRNDLRNTEKREILIFLTPKIIDDNLLDR